VPEALPIPAQPPTTMASTAATATLESVMTDLDRLESRPDRPS
jgi:hypothetical protein